MVDGGRTKTKTTDNATMLSKIEACMKPLMKPLKNVLKMVPTILLMGILSFYAAKLKSLEGNVADDATAHKKLYGHWEIYPYLTAAAVAAGFHLISEGLHFSFYEDTNPGKGEAALHKFARGAIPNVKMGCEIVLAFLIPQILANAENTVTVYDGATGASLDEAVDALPWSFPSGMLILQYSMLLALLRDKIVKMVCKKCNLSGYNPVPTRSGERPV